MVLAFHDRNTFNVINYMQLPFYSRNFQTINNQFFIRVDRENFKGVAHVDRDKMELIDYMSISTNGSKRTKGQLNRNIILDPYHLLIDLEAKHLYGIKKKKLVRYKIKSRSK